MAPIRKTAVNGVIELLRVICLKRKLARMSLTNRLTSIFDGGLVLFAILLTVFQCFAWIAHKSCSNVVICGENRTAIHVQFVGPDVSMDHS